MFTNKFSVVLLPPCIFCVTNKAYGEQQTKRLVAFFGFLLSRCVFLMCFVL